MKARARIISIILILSLGGVSVLNSSECGNINSDASINILDVVFLINYLYKGGEAPQDISTCDVDLSGSLNLLDVSYLIKYLYQGGPVLCPGTAVPAYQKYIFETEYLNWAWGYRLEGMVIDNQGHIYKYSYNHLDIPWDTASPGILTVADLDAKFGHNQVLTGFVPMDTLLKYYNMIEVAATGPVSPPVTRCFDFGLMTTLAYQLDTNSGNYNSVILHRSGDVAQMNFSPQANALYRWLWEDILGESIDSVICDY
ncbi:MAG: hypothetical protein CVT49_06405 [candidate division Zixibacteria bacterium HGW-Zixibacteria-1]|nr:MAG: hypothetical protein CVT49_06405 [candidate division Zixibacteria bacterium HGW-Zixibacteria-1]